MIADVPNSGVALAITQISSQKNKVFVASGPASSDLTGPKCNANMPRACAFWVIALANSSSLPARFSAIATATSFADLVTTALIASSTAMVWPGLRPSFEGACSAAWAEIRSGVSSLILPASSSSNRR